MTRRQLDLTDIRRFFLGVMKWAPRTLMQEATLQDLVDAHDGFMGYHGHSRTIPRPTPEFLKAMAARFPDTVTKHDNP